MDRRSDEGDTVDRSMEPYYREGGPTVIRRFETVAVESLSLSPSLSLSLWQLSVYRRPSNNVTDDAIRQRPQLSLIHI